MEEAGEGYFAIFLSLRDAASPKASHLVSVCHVCSSATLIKSPSCMRLNSSNTMLLRKAI